MIATSLEEVYRIKHIDILISDMGLPDFMPSFRGHDTADGFHQQAGRRHLSIHLGHNLG